ncbi:hypothetical protein J6590_037195 [Homalodisca vitripennis]|nr:hypothetical protein J6590_037195 [Homalodisca vitripennis]
MKYDPRTSNEDLVNKDRERHVDVGGRRPHGLQALDFGSKLEKEQPWNLHCHAKFVSDLITRSRRAVSHLGSLFVDNIAAVLSGLEIQCLDGVTPVVGLESGPGGEVENCHLNSESSDSPRVSEN